MSRNTSSLGDLITALYDAVGDDLGDEETASDDIVAACTIDVLLRQRRQRLVAELVLPREPLRS